MGLRFGPHTGTVWDQTPKPAGDSQATWYVALGTVLMAGVYDVSDDVGEEPAVEMAARRRPRSLAVLASLVAVAAVIGMILLQPDLRGSGGSSTHLAAGKVVEPAARSGPGPDVGHHLGGSSDVVKVVAPPSDGVAPLEEANFGLANPPANVLPIAPHPCFGGLSSACVEGWLESINHARALEGVAPMELPSNFESLPPFAQTFVLVNLERTARGVPPMVALVSPLDAVAQGGANRNGDPSLAGLGTSASIWSGGHASSLGAMYDWMYDDGPGSSNVDCPPSGGGGCWGHRDAILGSYNGCSGLCFMGSGYNAHSFGPGSWAAVFTTGDRYNAEQVVMTWQAEEAFLPACEQRGDSC